LGPEDLQDVLRFLPKGLPNANVIVGLDTPDDAGVYRINAETAIVQTVDFFTPIVDDPYWFGAIAAANSLSDIYAMGGRPITVLQLVGFPIARLPKEMLAEILRGSADKVAEAGAVILGGHSIDDPEPKFGLACTGIVHPDRIGAKAGARPGDRIILTKPIGPGVITTAIKRGIVSRAEQDEVIAVMAKLNNVVDVLEPFAVRGLTDITGFGLLGHASEVARESRAGMRIYASRVPVIPAARKYAEIGTFPGGSRNNHRFLVSHTHVDFDPALDETTRMLLCDAVTSGGLFICVPAEKADALAAALLEHGTISAALIGEVVAEHPGQVKVLP
jgi:selenide, water dikinase